MKFLNHEERLASHQRRMSLIDELTELKGEGTLIQRLSNEVTRQVIGKIEPMLDKCVKRKDYDKFYNQYELKIVQ